nr:O-antigen ligase family protein [Candidatus Krumholzibacteria bacterium]
VSAATMATGLCLIAGAVVVVRERGLGAGFPTSVVWALGALYLVYFLATVFSAPFPHHWGKLAEESWIKLLLLAVPILARGQKDLIRRVLAVLLFMAMLAAVMSVVQYLLGEDPIRGRSIFRPQFGHAAVSGFFSHHLSYAGQVLIMAMLAGAWVMGKQGPIPRVLTGVALLLLGVALVLTFARSAWLGVWAGLLVLVWLDSGRRRWYGLGTWLGLLAVLLAIPVSRVHFLNIFDPGKHLTRLNLWHSSLDGILANPVLGFGPGNFEALLADHQVPGHFETFGHAHNDLLMHGVNAGLPGIVAAVLLLVVVCRVIWRALPTSGQSAGILRGALAVQAGITVAGFFQVFQTDDEVEMLLYFVLGCALALAQEREVETHRLIP